MTSAIHPLSLSPLLPAHALPFVLVGTISLCLCYVLYYTLFHPLAKYPGPALAKVTNLWKFRTMANKDMHLVLHDLHTRLGDVVRIGPNTLSIRTPDQVKELYGAGSTWKKTEYYSGFMAVIDNLFGSRDEPLHRIRRRQYAHAFSQANMQGPMEQYFDVELRKFRGWLEKAADQPTQPVDIKSYMHWLVIDTLFSLCFGKSHGMLDHGDNELQPPIHYHLLISCVFGQMPWTLPYLRKYGLYSPVAWVRTGLKGRFAVRDMAAEAVQRALTRTSGRDDLLAGLIKSKNPETGEALTPIELGAEAFAMIVAGTHTSSVTLCLFVFYVTRVENAEILRKLVEELDAKLPALNSLSDIYACSAVMNEQLPYFEAVLKETHRLGGVFKCARSFSSFCLGVLKNDSMPLPRIVPPGGRELAGQWLPAGTEVASSVYAFHRNPAIWGKNAEVFRPERHLGDAGKSTEAYLTPFSVGHRSCIGRKCVIFLDASCPRPLSRRLSLANTEMHKLLTTLFRNYTVEAVDPQAELVTITLGVTEKVGPLDVRIRRR